MVFKLSKKVHFMQFVLTSATNLRPKSTKAIYIYASESSHHTLSENDMVYKGLSHCSWDNNTQKTKKDADLVEIFQNYPNIS